MTFTEDWFFDGDCKGLVDLYWKSKGHGAVIEVGCWEGRSTIALANACAPNTVHAVDTWEGSPGEISWDLAHERDVYEAFLTNIDTQTAGNVTPHRMGWEQFFDTWRDPIRFCHIDAEHTYEQVTGNIAAVVPHLHRGSVICGDDAHHPPVIAAARDALGDVQFAGVKLWWKEIS